MFNYHLNSVCKIDCKKHREWSVRKRERSTDNSNVCSSLISHCRKTCADRSQLFTAMIVNAYSELESVLGRKCLTWSWTSMIQLLAPPLTSFVILENHITSGNLNVITYKTDENSMRIKWTNLAHCLAHGNTSVNTTTTPNLWQLDILSIFRNGSRWNKLNEIIALTS